MCGLVGIIAKKKSAFSYKQQQLFEQMLFMDTLRGEDSTGVFGVTKVGNVEWWKDACAAPDFLEKSEIKKVLTNIIWDYVAMVGHNRKATKGTVKAENAHPFAEDNIVLVHNGTLSNHKDLHADVEVDSHAITHAISKHGVGPAIKKLDGAFALSFYDVDTKMLHLVRNKERPLFLAEFESFWAFASEPWMLFGGAWRNELKPSKIEEIPVATLLSFNFSEVETKFTQKEVKLFEPKKTVYPFPAVVGKGAAPASTKNNKILNFIDYFKRDKLICFKPSTLITENAGARMHGVHSKFPDVKIQCWMPDDKYTTAERLSLNTVEEVTGRIVGVSANSNTNSQTVFVTDLFETVPMFSANGTEINDELLDSLPMKCNKCKDVMTESDIEDSYVKVRPSGQVTMICPQCTAENLERNQHWGNINANKKVNHTTIH